MCRNKGLQENQIAAPPMRGFTYIELIIVILITAILTVIAIPFYPTGLNLNASVDELASTVLYAQSLAIGTGQVHSFQFAFSCGSPKICFEIQAITPTTQTVSYTTPPLPAGITITHMIGGAGGLVFDSNGVPYTGTAPIGTPLPLPSWTKITSPLVIGFTDGHGNNATLVILPGTGFAIPYHGSWQCYLGVAGC